MLCVCVIIFLLLYIIVVVYIVFTYYYFIIIHIIYLSTHVPYYDMMIFILFFVVVVLWCEINIDVNVMWWLAWRSVALHRNYNQLKRAYPNSICSNSLTTAGSFGPSRWESNG